MIINRGTSIDEIARRIAEGDEDIEDFSIEECKDSGKAEPGLVYTVFTQSSEEGQNFTTTFLHLDEGKKIPINNVIGQCFSICYTNGNLYQVIRQATILNALTKKEIKKEGNVVILCSHEGVLYHAESGARDDIIRRTLTDKKIFASESLEGINVMCSHEGVLYHGSHDGLYKTIKRESIKDLEGKNIRSLCSHEGELYYSIDKSIYSLSNENPIATRPQQVRGLCSYKGTLLDGGFYNSIIETSTGKVFLETPGRVYTMCAVGSIMVNKIMQMKK